MLHYQQTLSSKKLKWTNFDEMGKYYLCSCLATACMLNGQNLLLLYDRTHLHVVLIRVRYQIYIAFSFWIIANNLAVGSKFWLVWQCYVYDVINVLQIYPTGFLLAVYSWIESNCKHVVTKSLKYCKNPSRSSSSGPDLVHIV